MGKYEVTQEQYKTIMGNNPSYFEGKNSQLNKWDGIVQNEFCEKFSKKYGIECRLPTEAEGNMPVGQEQQQSIIGEIR